MVACAVCAAPWTEKCELHTRNAAPMTTSPHSRYRRSFSPSGFGSRVAVTFVGAGARASSAMPQLRAPGAQRSSPIPTVWKNVPCQAEPSRWTSRSKV